MATSPESKPTPEVLLVEYQVAYGGVLHYDSFRWSSGSMLIAGVFLFWGVVFTTDTSEELFGPASVVVTLVMTLWMFYASHYRQLYLSKLHRVQEIERLLGMEANLRFLRRPHSTSRYGAVGPKGHALDLYLYLLICSAGSTFSFVRIGFVWWQIAPLAIALAGSIAVHRNEALLIKRLAN